MSLFVESLAVQRVASLEAITQQQELLLCFVPRLCFSVFVTAIHDINVVVV
jgi:flagellar biosynthesis protein FliQ